MCGRLLVPPRNTKSKRSYQCTEFSAVVQYFALMLTTIAANTNYTKSGITVSLIWTSDKVCSAWIHTEMDMCK